MQDNYFKIKRLSASLINRFYQETFLQKTFSVKPETLIFGSLVHTEIYEKHLFPVNTDLALKELNRLKRMAEVARKTPTLAYFLKHPLAQFEQAILFDLAGMPFKAKLDCRIPKSWHDAKTTACRNQADFLNAFFEYGYDRQTAVYKAATGGCLGMFTGICKAEPHNTFLIDTNKYKRDITKAGKAVIELAQHYLTINKNQIIV